MSLYVYGNDIISIDNSGVISYYVTDGAADVRALADENGQITDTYSYDAFGIILEKTGGTYNPYLYNQQQYDASTGLYYLRARYMNPSTGRFVSMDEYAGNVYDPSSLHKYLYASGNPVMYCDPTGYQSYAETAASLGILEILYNTATIKASAALRFIIANLDDIIFYAETLYLITTLILQSDSSSDSDTQDEIADEADSTPDTPDDAEDTSDDNVGDTSDDNFRNDAPDRKPEEREVKIPRSVERQAKKLSPEAKRGYDRAIKGLKNNDMRGLNDHGLKHNLSGRRAVDIKGTGSNRGGGRIEYRGLPKTPSIFNRSRIFDS